MRRKRVAITGATGLLGRNLFLEIAKNALRRREDVDVLLLGRSKDGRSLRKRALEILRGDGAAYCGLDDPSPLDGFFDRNVRCVGLDLDAPRLGLSEAGLGELRSAPIDHFFHLAARTDLRDSPSIAEALRRTNVEGTAALLDLVSSLRVQEFDYAGSAYSCGDARERIPPDYVPPPSARHRNPYERTKLDAELAVRAFAKRSRVRCRYFRPSILCGRLLEKPVGQTSKFDVFYAWGAFFLRARRRARAGAPGADRAPVRLPARIRCSEQSGLNIVPVDFAAKAMHAICFDRHDGESYHLVNAEETPHRLYVPLMAESLGVTGLECVSDLPADPNALERVYYRTVGAIYTPYVTSEPMRFDASGVEPFLRARGLVCPAVDRKGFLHLMEFARNANFGVAGAPAPATEPPPCETLAATTT